VRKLRKGLKEGLPIRPGTRKGYSDRGVGGGSSKIRSKTNILGDESKIRTKSREARKARTREKKKNP